MKLYCGTYAKYNNGSLFGKWLDLDKFANADEFEAACRRLHRDERDPEFMFQDVETDPGEDWQEGLSRESSIPRDYWRLKAEAEAEKKREAEAERKSGTRAAEKAEQDRLCRAYVEAREGITEADNPNRWAKEWKYYRQGHYFYTLSDGVIATIQRPSIQTRFCCGEDDRGQGGEGPGTLAYAHKVNAEKHTEQGFTRANLRAFENDQYSDETKATTLEYAAADEVRRAQMKAWRQKDVLAVVWRRCGEKEWMGQGSAYWDSEVVRIFNAEDFARMGKAVERVREDFKKRLAAWWKRFGAEHVHTWTYWTEA